MYVIRAGGDHEMFFCYIEVYVIFGLDIPRDDVYLLSTDWP